LEGNSFLIYFSNLCYFVEERVLAGCALGLSNECRVTTLRLTRPS